MPPMAGPSIRVTLNPSDLRAIAFIKSFFGTVLAMSACRNGFIELQHIPVIIMNVNACHISTVPEAIIPANVKDANERNRLTIISNIRRLRRSINTPMNGPMMRNGMYLVPTMIATVRGELDNSHANQAMLIFCIQCARPLRNDVPHNSL